MAVKYTKIFYPQAFQNLPKLTFLVWKYTIWQPCLRHDLLTPTQVRTNHARQTDSFPYLKFHIIGQIQERSFCEDLSYSF
jgi:hypothetical protein